MIVYNYNPAKAVEDGFRVIIAGLVRSKYTLNTEIRLRTCVNSTHLRSTI